jgi:hypothetical protein
MAAPAFDDDHRRHEHAKSPTRPGVRARGSGADLPHRSCTAGQPCRRTSFARILGGSASGAQCGLVPVGCRRVARDRRCPRRALSRGRSSPNRNSARRRSRVRALCASVSGGPIESHASHGPWRRGLVARGLRPAVPKRGVTRRLARRSRGLVLGGMWLRWRTGARAQELDGLLARGSSTRRGAGHVWLVRRVRPVARRAAGRARLASTTPPPGRGERRHPHRGSTRPRGRPARRRPRERVTAKWVSAWGQIGAHTHRR